MLEFESIINSIVYILFPMLLYYIYIAYKKNTKEKQETIILEIILLLSLMLNVVFYKKTTYNILIIFIPLLVSYKNNRTLLNIITSIILIDFYFNLNPASLEILIITNILLYIVYIICKNKNNNNLLYYQCTIITIFYIIYFVFYKDIMDNYYILLINLVIFYVSIFIVFFISKKTANIMRFYMYTKEIEKEKLIKLSLFKITHEIKNPLAVIKGYVDMFDPNNISKSERYIKVINDETNRTLNILNDLSSLSTIKIKKDIMDLWLLFDDVKQLIIPFCETKKVKYAFQLEGDYCEITADYGRLQQVIVNMLKNAVESCEKNGEIVCIAYPYGNKIFIIIKDNGVGMTEEEINNLFIPFNTSKPTGTGLGVCLSKEIIDTHNGKITYYSKKGKGTTVKITIPMN